MDDAISTIAQFLQVNHPQNINYPYVVEYVKYDLSRALKLIRYIESQTKPATSYDRASSQAFYLAFVHTQVNLDKL